MRFRPASSLQEKPILTTEAQRHGEKLGSKTAKREGRLVIDQLDHCQNCKFSHFSELGNFGDSQMYEDN